METVRASETSVNFNVTTRRYITEYSKCHTLRRENLKSHATSSSKRPTVNAVKGNGSCLLLEPSELRKYTLWAKFRVILLIKTDGACCH
jgi:hypothetical protein